MPSKRDIEAAIAAYNSTDQERFVLPPEAVRLLAAMFRRSDTCQRRLQDLEAPGLDQRTIRRLLRALVFAGFVSTERGGRSFVTTYHLHLPPVQR